MDWEQHLQVALRLTGRNKYAFSHGISVSMYKASAEYSWFAYLDEHFQFSSHARPGNLNPWLNSFVGLEML